MMRLLNKKTAWHSLMGALAVGCSLFATSCDDAAAPMKWVDLRYIAEDQYLLSASAPEPIKLQVKSTDPWTVYSQHADWCAITPDKGGAEELFDVTVTYGDNTELDDRIDTLFIQSDYWIGKRIHVLQQGIAYLNLENDQDFLLSEGVDSRTFNVLSNQGWSAVVTGGSEWLMITHGAEGSLDGSVTVQTIENKGEKRYGKVSVYDRHGVERAAVTVIQDGLQLDPDQNNIRVYYEAQQVVINVISNAEWTVKKDDEDIEWYDFETTEFNGNSELILNLRENAGSTVRKASFTLSTKLIDGVNPVTKTIVIKQANNPTAVRSEFDDMEKSKWSVNGGSPSFVNGDVTFNGNSRITRDGFEPGYYSFRIKSMSSNAVSRIFFTYGSKEIRWHLDAAAKKTAYSTTPWSMANETQRTFDPTVPHTISLNLTDAGNGLTRIEWIMDGEVLYTYVKEQDFTLAWPSTSFTYLGAGAGEVVYDWWEYTAPINWGD